MTRPTWDRPLEPRKLGPREHRIRDLSLNEKTIRALQRAGIWSIEELMGHDPIDWISPIGPEPTWIHEVTELRNGGNMVFRYQQCLEGVSEWRHQLEPMEPWIEFRQVGIITIQYILEAIEEWRGWNRIGETE